MRHIALLFFVSVAVVAAHAADERPAIQADNLPVDWHVSDPAAFAGGTVEDRWWQNFEDPLLDSLIDQALSANYDISMAVRRIEMARTAVGKARAAYFPQVGVSASYNRARTSGMTGNMAGNAATGSYFDIGANVSWEIDVFGKITASVRQAKASERVSAADARAVALSVAAQTASAYFSLRVHQAQLQVSLEHCERQDSVLNIARARHETGLASMMDVNQAEQVYYTTRASIPNLQAAIHADINALAIMLGIVGDDIFDVLSVVRPLPEYYQLVPCGHPADLLRRRPDVIQAEREIDVAAAGLGIAKKDWLPSLSVSATAGTQAHRAGDLFSNQSLGYSVAPTLSWTVFDGLARKYAVADARASLRNAVENYNQTVLSAFAEVDDAMNSYVGAIRYIKAMDDVVTASASYNDRALENYRSGLSPFLNVANSQMTLLENLNSLIVAKGDALNELVTLYKALGGSPGKF